MFRVAYCGAGLGSEVSAAIVGGGYGQGPVGEQYVESRTFLPGSLLFILGGSLSLLLNFQEKSVNTLYRGQDSIIGAAPKLLWSGLRRAFIRGEKNLT